MHEFCNVNSAGDSLPRSADHRHFVSRRRPSVRDEQRDDDHDGEAEWDRDDAALRARTALPSPSAVQRICTIRSSPRVVEAFGLRRDLARPAIVACSDRMTWAATPDEVELLAG